MPMAKNVSQMGITKAALATATGKAKQILIVRDDGFRPVVMDGTTAGGHPVAMKSEVVSQGTALTQALNSQKTELEQKIAAATSDVVRYSAQSLNASQKGQVRTNIGLGTAAVKAEGDFVSSAELTTALSDLITEFGGTVPAD